MLKISIVKLNIEISHNKVYAQTYWAILYEKCLKFIMVVLGKMLTEPTESSLTKKTV